MHWKRSNLCTDKNKGKKLPQDDSCEKLRNLKKCNANAHRPMKRYAITLITTNTKIYAGYKYIIN